jgi:hypothetical protein
VKEGLHDSNLHIDTEEFNDFEAEIHRIEKNHREFCKYNLLLVEAFTNRNDTNSRDLKRNIEDKRKQINDSILSLRHRLQQLTLNSSQATDQHESHVLKVNSIVLILASLNQIMHNLCRSELRLLDESLLTIICSEIFPKK